MADRVALPGKKPLMEMTANPANYETPLEYFREPVTPNDAFYIRSHGIPPTVAAREPAGKIQWVIGPATKVFWAGIYGTCLIQAPNPREALGVVERTALECECNGWMPTQ